MATLEVSLDKVEKSKIFVSKVDAFSFKHPSEYINPFIDKFSGMDIKWSLNAEVGSQNRDKEEEFIGEDNIAYSSLIVKAKLPSEFDFEVNDDLFKDLFTEIGFVYNLDSQKPEMKLYRGNRVSICHNMCIWGASNISSILLTSGRQGLNDLYDKTSRYIDTSMDMIRNQKIVFDRMTETEYKKGEINEKFGELVRLGINNKKLGINCVTGAIGDMLDKKSRYGIQDDKITAWKMYNSLTEQLKKASILSESSKSLLLEELFQN